jgi:hypothetical protein
VVAVELVGGVVVVLNGGVVAGVVVDGVVVPTVVVVGTMTTVLGVQSGHVVVVAGVVVVLTVVVAVVVAVVVEGVVGYVVVDVGCEYPATAAEAQPVNATSRIGVHRLTASTS